MCLICISIVMVTAISTTESMFCMVMNTLENTILLFNLSAPLTTSMGANLEAIMAGMSPERTDTAAIRQMHERNVAGVNMSLVSMPMVDDSSEGS